MSGFEIAGVVLGSIPLIVSTLENYKNGLRTIQRWRKYDRELQSLIRNLKTERVKLQNICEKLLDGLVPSSRIDTMVEDPGGLQWKDEATQRKIRARLWQSWDVFEETIADIQRALDEMNKRLGTGADIKWADKLLPVKELKRANFTLSWSTYSELLDTIKNGISNIESLTNMSFELEPKRRMRSHIRILDILRNLSSRVYHLINTNLTCTCRHHFSLRLSNHLDHITPLDDEDEVLSSLKMHVAMSLDTPNSHKTSSTAPVKGIWEQFFIQAKLQVQNMSGATRFQPPNVGTMLDAEKRKEKTVRFAPLRFSFSTTKAVTDSETSTIVKLLNDANTGATEVAPPNPQPRQSLCEKLEEMRLVNSPGCSSVILDHLEANHKEYTVNLPTHKSPDGEALQMISLRELLEHGSGDHPLTYKQRLRLAVIIAISTLQLYNTPWLPTIPNSQNILFAQRGHFIDYTHAFVMAQEGDTKAEIKPLPIIQNPTLLALGVTLVEILYGQTIESLRISDEVLGVEMTSLSGYMTARRLLGEICQTSFNYGSAVRRCIEGEFQMQNLDLESQDFRHEVYCGVISLLEADLNNI